MNAEGREIPLEGFEHITVQYPYNWDQPNRLHVNDSTKGSGAIWNPIYALAFARAVIAAFDEAEIEES